MSFMSLFGVKYVRGGAVFEFRDDADVVLNDPSRPDDRQLGRTGNKRKVRLHLDPAQYYLDMKNGVNCYESLNLLVRRKPKENNFKAILETIRDLINTAALGRAIPPWLNDVFLGYGNPAAANYRTLNPSGAENTNYTDTFVDAQHLVESFPTAREIIFESESGEQFVAKQGGVQQIGADWPSPPYVLDISKTVSVPSAKQAKTKSKLQKSATIGEADGERVVARHFSRPNQGPYPEDRPPVNAVRFTPTQVEAIRSGVNPGLTMIVGPPGTGKTDVAVQIIANLYHNFPLQKILIVTHSNAALNDLFEKIMERDVAPRHLLRLGSGEADLREALAVAGAKGGGNGQGEVFSKQGRVNWSLARRLQLLTQVQFLAQSLTVSGDMGASCETAEFFHLQYIQPRLDKFREETTTVSRSGTESTSSVKDLFPFLNYFTETPLPLFTGDWQTDLVAAEGCFVHINNVFQELADYRAFELLRTQRLRSDYLLTKQARIVAMTCTHAAMTRNNLVQLGFNYDSVVMEEAAQILEVETLIPMLLQDSDPVDGSRLKRVVLIGDHHQLPPVVKHLAFQKFSKLDQSLFTRFVRLGVPTVQLDRQGRSRAEIAALYSWRYLAEGKSLGNLDQVARLPQFKYANAGFAHTVQLVNVPAFQGRGESCPTPYFYQNLGEAEYVVAVFQYMRLLGYPAEKISIITSYNGQKHLIRDIISQRCQNAVFGRPAHITTVDKFQGQQNDFVLLSLVRTETVGHLRDVRRLVVALSRARLGLYVFCRQQLFENCYELSPAFHQLLERPSTLQLVAGEGHPLQVERTAEATVTHDVADVTAMGVLVYQMVQQAQHAAE
jgi:intron-binding protein aquarius